jgi:hypothetical protein
MTMSSLTYILGFSVRFFQPVYSVTIPAKFAFIWYSGFRGKDLNMIFYQNTCMSNLYNRYKSVERKISQKNPVTNQNELKF